jgi:mono/diheme cytochrome c family protein
MLRTSLIVATLVFVTPAIAIDAPRTTAVGVYTEDQARNGERAYHASCAVCHGLDLRRVDAEAPDLVDGPFRYAWNGKALSERFEKLRDTMPKGNPGSLNEAAYLDLVAYLMRANGVPVGTEPLTKEGLRETTVEIPAATPGTSRRRR